MAKLWELSTILIGMVCILSGCSTIGKSTTAGAGTGAVFGGIAGSLVPGEKPKSILIGTAAGATLGALSGALIHKNMEDKEREAFQNGKNVNGSAGRGTLVSASRGSTNRKYVPPKIERRWLDDEIRGNVLVEGHYEQIVVEEGRWE